MKFDFSGYKIQPERVPLDDYEVKSRDGSVCRPHVGESVWLDPDGLSVEETKIIGAFYAKAQASNLARKGKVGKREREVAELEGATNDVEASFDAMCTMLVGKLVAWDITDNRRVPYDQPDDVEAVQRIPTELLMHMLNLVQGGETEGNAGAGEAGSPDGSSTTPGSGKTTKAS